MPRGRKPEPNQPHILINGNKVTWAFIKLVYKRLHGDWDDTIDAFWKARNCTGANGIQRYIMSGFKRDENGRQWIAMPSKERENGKMEKIREWWLNLYKPSRTDARPSVSTVSTAIPDVKSMLETLTEGMSF